MNDDFIGIHGIEIGHYDVGIGQIIIPDENDREQYISDCYRTHTVSIKSSLISGYLHNVKVDEEKMQSIKFPDEKNSGSLVVWVKDNSIRTFVIISVIRKQDEYYFLKENQFFVKKNNISQKRVVEFFMDGEESSMVLNLIGDKDKPANLKIKLNSENSDSLLELYSDNEINLHSDKNVTLTTNQSFNVKVKDLGKEKMNLSYVKNEGFIYKDEFDNEIKTLKNEVQIISNTIKHNQGNESMVLGDTLLSKVSKLLDSLSKLTVLTAFGESSVPVNFNDYVSLKNELNDFLSKKSKLD